MPVSRFMTYHSGNTGVTAFHQPPQGWADAKYRVIALKAPPSETLLNWLATWATKAVGGTWVLNNNLGTTEVSASVGFISNGIYFNSLQYENKGGKFGYTLTYGGNSGVTPYTEGWTLDEAYRTITFLEPPTGELLEWLNANGVKQT